MRLVYVVLAWTTGIVFAHTFDAFSALVWMGFVVLVGAAGVLVWRVRATHASPLPMIVLLGCFVLGGLRYAVMPTTSAIAAYNGTGGLTIAGVIVGEPDIRDEQTLLRVRVETVERGGEITPSSGNVLVRAPRLVDVQYGDRVRATGLLITPGEYDTFSYADYLGRRGVFSIMDQAAVELVSSGHGSPFYRVIYDLRRDVQRLIAYNLPEPQAGLLTGILTGNERGISPELEDDFSATGASHIVAISGFNMVIIAGVVMGFLNRLNIPQGRAMLTGIAVIALYTVFAGANAAVIRAAVMTSVLFVGQALRRKTYVPASLAFVALMMSVLDPHVLWDVSFQLSFFATLGLALFVEPLQRGFETMLRGIFAGTRHAVSLPRDTDFVWTVGGWLSEPLIVTLAAQITTLPLILFYFNRVSFVALAVNLLIIPVQSYLLILGGFATLVAFVLPPLAQILYWLDMVLLTYTIGVVRAFARLPFAEAVYSMDSRLIYGYFAALVGWGLLHAVQPEWWVMMIRFVRNRLVFNAVIFSGAALTVLMGALYFARPDGQLHVWFLDMGHSNAVLVQTPGGAQILVDGGRFPSRLLTALGDRMPFTDRTIDVLVITQPDEFDIAALTAVLDRYDVGVTLTNGQPNLSETVAQINDRLVGQDMVTVTAGYTLETDDGVLLEVLHPQDKPTLSDELNDAPLVLRLTYGEVSLLLTGDVSADAQVSMLDSGAFPLATVLQLPQHGTQRSLDADFLAVVQPRAIVIQSDKANRRGDPHVDVLSLLPEGVPVFRTDEQGTIHLRTDGHRLLIDGVK